MHVLNEKILKEQIEQTIRSDIESGKVGGVAVSVMQDGKTIYQACFDDLKNDVHVSEHTLFRMASMTKPITAVAVLMLVDRGLLDLDMPVSQIVPDFAQMNIGQMVQDKIKLLSPAKIPITVRQLLSHSSGLGSGPVGDHIRASLPQHEVKTLAQAVAYYAKNPLDFEPSTAQSYSAIHAFDVLARIVEVISGMPYDTFLKKELFSPLGMVDTTFSPTAEQWKRMIPMHSYINGNGITVDFPENSLFDDVPTTRFCGGAGLASTLSDYKKFADMLLHYGAANGQQLIREKIIREMATPQVPPAIMPGPEVWGLGVRVITDPSYMDLPCGSFGWSGAYGTHFWVDPENRIVAVYLKNSRYDGGSGALTARRFEQDVAAAI